MVILSITRSLFFNIDMLHNKRNRLKTIFSDAGFNIDMLHNKRNRLKTIFSDAGFTQISNTATRTAQR